MDEPEELTAPRFADAQPARRSRLKAVLVVVLVCASISIPLSRIHENSAAQPLATGDNAGLALLVSTSAGFVAVSPETGSALARLKVVLPAGLQGASLQGFAAEPGSPDLYADYETTTSAWSNVDQGNVVVKVPLADGKGEVLTGGENVALSPDGRELAWVEESGSAAFSLLVVRSLVTGQQRSVSLSELLGSGDTSSRLGAMTWLSDDSTLAIVISNAPFDNTRIVTVPIQAGAPSSKVSFIDLTPAGRRTIGNQVDSLSWLPGGRTLVLGGSSCINPELMYCAGQSAPLAEVDGISGRVTTLAVSGSVLSASVSPRTGSIAVVGQHWTGGALETYAEVLGWPRVDLSNSYQLVQWVSTSSLRTLTVAAGHTRLPSVIGDSVEAAESALTKADARWVVRKGASQAQVGTISTQTPIGGTIVGDQTIVRLVVSGGLPQSPTFTTTTSTSTA
ncbi:MAG: PASTA domain-containing protein [Acidimicrobiales bacterium]